MTEKKQRSKRFQRPLYKSRNLMYFRERTQRRQTVFHVLGTLKSKTVYDPCKDRCPTTLPLNGSFWFHPSLELRVHGEKTSVQIYMYCIHRFLGTRPHKKVEIDDEFGFRISTPGLDTV